MSDTEPTRQNRPPLRREPLYLSATVVLIMLDMLRRMFAPNSWFFAISIWVMQFLVLFFVVRDSVVRALRNRKIKARKRELRALLHDGQGLQQNTPNSIVGSEVEGWRTSVGRWIDNTTKELDGFSPQAAVAFKQIQKSPSSQHGVSPAIGELYGNLVQHVDNLRSIMEKPEVYY